MKHVQKRYNIIRITRISMSKQGPAWQLFAWLLTLYNVYVLASNIFSMLASNCISTIIIMTYQWKCNQTTTKVWQNLWVFMWFWQWKTRDLYWNLLLSGHFSIRSLEVSPHQLLRLGSLSHSVILRPCWSRDLAVKTVWRFLGKVQRKKSRIQYS